MDYKTLLFLGIFISFSISTELFSQSLTLVGDAKLSLKGKGVIFSAPSIQLKDNSQLSNPAYAISGSTLTYTAANNGYYALTSGDRVQFDYYY